ncbi:MAG TPA: hypothetical protein H9948_08830 [Candidatus Jeotgalibaca merdavium]|uniref:Uncharacterized protein n=1 Tax=Candidatus Jeotgalibaca merdavium TaxID=2838627 RepID=A0A9D2I380_9LACT|nr:hypothetical protein [Candidatus Jeotgalibaca merdavium]
MSVNNGLGDLQNFLFGQLERLDNPDLSPEELKQEINRSEAMAKIAGKAIENAQTVIKAKRLYNSSEDYVPESERPKMLEG